MRYVEAAYIAGTSDLRILMRHVIPNAMAPVLAQLSVNIGWAILLTVGLSFIGAGVRAPTPEWGSMIAMGFQNIVTGQWWPSIFPGHGAGRHRLRLLAGRLQRRGAGRSGATPQRLAGQIARQARLGRRGRGVGGARTMLSYIGRRLIFVGTAAARHRAGQLPPGEAHPRRSGGADAGPDRDRTTGWRACAPSWASTARCSCSSASICGASSTAISARPGRRRMPVTEDLVQRFPATLELVTLRCCWRMLIGMPLGVAAARHKRGVSRKIADYYGLFAGALPDFWFALVLIFVFYTMLGIVPAPLGRIDIAVIPPPTVTGSLLIDSLVARRLAGAADRRRASDPAGTDARLDQRRHRS